jgi:NitT/TauT family transport system permease protein
LTILRWRLLLSVVIVAGWQALWQFDLMPRATIGSPSTVLGVLVTWFRDGTVLSHLPTTLLEVGAGLVIGATLGVASAVSFANLPRLTRVMNPLMAILNAVPSVILAPLFLLVLGIGVPSKIAMSAVLVFFGVFFAVLQGLNEIDQGLIDSVRVQGASRTAVIANVTVPASVVWLLGSMRLAVSYSFLGALVAEYLGSTVGIGYLIANGAQLGRVEVVMAGLALVATIVLLADVLVTRGTRRFTAWSMA